MSIRWDSTSLIAGANLWGDPGHGVLAENVPSSGASGAGLVFDLLNIPADNGKEVRALVTGAVSGPDPISLYVHEDTSFELVVGADGTYTFPFNWVLDGVSQGSEVATINVGAVAGVTGTITATAEDAVSSMSGAVHIVGSMAVTAEDATMSASGVSDLTVRGTLSAIAEDATMSASGYVVVVGVLSATAANAIMRTPSFASGPELNIPVAAELTTNVSQAM